LNDEVTVRISKFRERSVPEPVEYHSRAESMDVSFSLWKNRKFMCSFIAEEALWGESEKGLGNIRKNWVNLRVTTHTTMKNR